jgi:hypothetical protein
MGVLHLSKLTSLVERLSAMGGTSVASLQHKGSQAEARPNTRRLWVTSPAIRSTDKRDARRVVSYSENHPRCTRSLTARSSKPSQD